MSIKETVAKGFKVTGQSMGLVMALFVFGTAWNLINLYVSRKFQAGASPTTPSPVLAVLGVIFLLVSIYVQAGSLVYIHSKLKSDTANLSMLLSSGGKYYLRLLLAGIVIALVAGLFFVVGGLAVSALKTVGIAIAVVLAGVGIYFVMLLFLAPYIIVSDDRKVVESIKSSVSIVRKNLLTVFGIALILIAVGFLVGIVLGLVMGGVGVAVKGAASQVIIAVASSFVNAFLGVVVTGTFMAFYLDYRNTQGAN